MTLHRMIEPGASFAHGVWVEGHIDKAEFADLAECETGLYCDPADVHHLYMRRLPSGELRSFPTGGSGSWPITVWEWRYKPRLASEIAAEAAARMMEDRNV